MKYTCSILDNRNMKWFANDMTCASLASMSMSAGRIRGLSPFRMDFRYPISVIAGQNGTGKSTLLALAACAFHSHEEAALVPSRRRSYYTMADFFVQASGEVSPQGICLEYEFLFDNWKPTPDLPKGIGRGTQCRTKMPGGKWPDYSRRVPRNVAFFGVQRVVPHAERSVSKTYRRYFRPAEAKGIEKQVCEVVGRILRKTYDKYWLGACGRHRLPSVETEGIGYSGFNMGAGENALFDIIATILSAPKGLLAVVDEIELGLHAAAQKRLIEELKVLCESKHLQVICTTHSPVIVNAVPLEGRFMLMRRGKKTSICEGVSAAYAAGIMGEEPSDELHVFVEDEVAEALLSCALPVEIRRRIQIVPIGSDVAVIRQLIARRKHPAKAECLGLLDGDKRSEIAAAAKLFQSGLEKSGKDDLEWFQQRLAYLPGEQWPESWAMTMLKETDTAALASSLGTSAADLGDMVERAMLAGKHSEFASLSRDIALPIRSVLSAVAQHLSTSDPRRFADVSERIVKMLG